MKLYIIIILFLSVHLKTRNISPDKSYEESLEIFDRLNNFETVVQNQDFIIRTTKKSKAYFDSFDHNAVFWISTNHKDYISHKDEKITGKFYTIEPNTDYYIRNFIFYDNPIVIKKYLYPLNINEEEIKINEDNEEINFLYLEKDKKYTLDFQGNKIKKMIKLSHKTLNSKIKILIDNVEKIELNQDVHYYKIEENFSGKLMLDIKENDAFIEFLSDVGEYTILKDLSYEKEIEKDIQIINIPKTQKNFRFYLTSNEPFKYSLSYGFSILENYYYYSNNNTKITTELKKGDEYTVYVELIGSFKDIDLLENEFISFSVSLERKENQKIYLKYHQFSLLDNIYDEEISEENCTKIIDNLKDVLEIYIYIDIAQNPPDIPNYPNYHHKPVDLREELDKIPKSNRKFYEFYQDIQRVLCITKDLHFNIYAHATPQGIPFAQYEVKLPFNFEIKKDNNNDYRVYIKKNDNYNNISDTEKKFLDSHLDIPLKAINDMDPFDYIQNWSKYRQTKNFHSQFTYVLEIIPSFFLYSYPVEYSDLYNDYEFDDNEIIRLFYINNFESVKSTNVEFNNYFLKVFKNQKTPVQLPPMNVIKDEFLISKGLKQRKKIFNDNKINWDINYEENDDGRLIYLKCRIDEENKVNVLVQNSFNFNPYKGIEKSLDCARLFHSNEYPVIIIEDYNRGGDLNILIVLHQALQVRTVDRSYEAFRISNISREYYKKDDWNFVDIETCENYKSFDNMQFTTDYYNYNNKNVEHKRTKVVDRFIKEFRNALNNFREEYFNTTRAKKPTDIIIFTDAFSYSAGSGFIKGFQNTGGAILVGYFGNPKINGTEFFDASQSDSNVQTLPNTNMSKNLNELGFTIHGVTTAENYDDFYQKENPIPREYTLDPVDYRVDIYSRYSDEIYDIFIKEGLEIRNLFNNGSYCNPKNDKLLLHDDKCYTIEEKKYAHGGYKCNNESKWDKEKCEPYYCDIGYYYDQFYQECREECPYYKNKKYFLIHEKNISKIFNIEPKMAYSFRTLKVPDYYYTIYTTELSMNRLPKFFFLKANEEISIENINNQPLPVKITSVNSEFNPNIRHSILYVKAIDVFVRMFESGKIMFFLQSTEDSCFYIDNVLKRGDSKIKLLKYNNSISSEDIININDKYYIDITGDIMLSEKNQLNIIYFDFKVTEEVNFYFNKLKSENITMIDNLEKTIFLEKNKNYNLDFVNNTISYLMIKLSRKTINAEIIILDKNIKLNSNNLYYTLEPNFTDKLNLKIGNENALIEILIKREENDLEIIDLGDKSELKLNKKINFIQIPKNYNSKDLSFTINKEGTSYVYIYHDYSMPGYLIYYRLNSDDNGITLNNFQFNITEHYKDDIKLMNNEYYYLIIQTHKNDLNISVNIEKIDKKQKSDESKNDDEGLKAWHIALIIIGSLIVTIFVFVLVICYLKKRKLTNEDIEDDSKPLMQLV